MSGLKLNIALELKLSDNIHSLSDRVGGH